MQIKTRLDQALQTEIKLNQDGQTRPDQTRPDQTRPDQTRPKYPVPNQTGPRYTDQIRLDKYPDWTRLNQNIQTKIKLV